MGGLKLASLRFLSWMRFMMVHKRARKSQVFVFRSGRHSFRIGVSELINWEFHSKLLILLFFQVKMRDSDLENKKIRIQHAKLP